MTCLSVPSYHQQNSRPICTLKARALPLPGRCQLVLLFPKWGQGRLVRVSSLKAEPSNSLLPPTFPT